MIKRRFVGRLLFSLPKQEKLAAAAEPAAKLCKNLRREIVLIYPPENDSIIFLVFITLKSQGQKKHFHFRDFFLSSGKMMEKSVWRTSGHGSSSTRKMRARTEIE